MHSFIHYSLKDHSPTPSLSVSDLVLFYSLIHSCIHSFPCPFTLTPPHSVLPSFTYSPPAITIVATWICTLQIRKTLTVLVTTLQTAMKDWKDCDTIATFCSKSSLVLPLTDRTLASMSSKQCIREHAAENNEERDRRRVPTRRHPRGQHSSIRYTTTSKPTTKLDPNAERQNLETNRSNNWKGKQQNLTNIFETFDLWPFVHTFPGVRNRTKIWRLRRPIQIWRFKTRTSDIYKVSRCSFGYSKLVFGCWRQKKPYFRVWIMQMACEYRSVWAIFYRCESRLKNYIIAGWIREMLGGSEATAPTKQISCEGRIAQTAQSGA